MVSPVQAASLGLTFLTFLPLSGVIIPFYLNMILQASCTVLIGCYASVHDPSKSAEENQKETLNKKDVMKFPLYGSCTLFGLFVLLKFFKELVNVLMVCYFMFLGVLALAGLMGPIVRPYLPGPLGNPKQFKITLPVFEELKFNAAEAVCAVFGAVLAVIYGVTRHWLCNNIFGIAFSIKGIEMIHIGSYFNGAIMLCGLFFYDIFWVFGTPVMVTVAKSFDAPIKLVFPRDFDAPPDKRFSMLGLGDIVVPALFIALLLRWDLARRAKGEVTGKGYFWPVWGSYILGLVVTVVVMMGFNAAQPALLYLVPACLLSSMAVAYSRNELSTLFAYAETEDHHGNDEPWFTWPWSSEKKQEEKKAE